MAPCHTLKIFAILLLLALTGCKQPANKPAARPPLIEAAQAQDVLKILTMTDPLDKMIRAGNAGQPFVDLAKEVEVQYIKWRNKLPMNNAVSVGLRRVVDELKRIIDGYSVAQTLVAGTVQDSKQTPFDLVAEAWTRKTLLRKILDGSATEREWQVFELGQTK